MTIFKGNKITSSTRPGIFTVTGFSTTHYFAADKQGVIYRFKRSVVSRVMERKVFLLDTVYVVK